MAWKPRSTRVLTALLVAIFAPACQPWAQTSTTRIQTAPDEPAAPAAAETSPDMPPAAPAGAAQPGPTATLTPAPPVAQVQRDVEEFVNRFPDSDLARYARPRSAAAPVSEAPPDPVVAPTAVRQASPPPDGTGPATAHRANATEATQHSPVIETGPFAQPAARPDTPVQTPARNPVTGAEPDHSAAEARVTLQAPGTPADDAPAVRANAPMAPRVVRAGSFVTPPAEPAPPRIASVEVAALPPPSRKPSPSRPEPNRAATATPTSPPRDMDGIIADLERAVAERPNDFAALFRLRMLYLADGRDEQAAAPVVGLDPEWAGTVTELTRMLMAVRDAANDPLNRSAQAVEAARGLLERLRQQAPVTIDKVALVSRVNSYGDYEEISPATFPAGQPARVILYAEISNFRGERTDDGWYRTLLGEKVELFDANGKSVLKHVHDKIPDTCRRMRTDFFLALELVLPETLAPGPYILKVTVEDKLSATADQAQLNLVIGPAARP